MGRRGGWVVCGECQSFPLGGNGRIPLGSSVSNVVLSLYSNPKEIRYSSLLLEILPVS